MVPVFKREDQTFPPSHSTQTQAPQTFCSSPPQGAAFSPPRPWLPAAAHDCLGLAGSSCTIHSPKPGFTQIVFYIANWLRTRYPHRFLETLPSTPQGKPCSYAPLRCFWHTCLLDPQPKPSSRCSTQHFQNQTSSMGSVFILFSLSQIYNLPHVIHLKFKMTYFHQIFYTKHKGIS